MSTIRRMKCTWTIYADWLLHQNACIPQCHNKNTINCVIRVKCENKKKKNESIKIPNKRLLIMCWMCCCMKPHVFDRYSTFGFNEARRRLTASHCSYRKWYETHRVSSENWMRSIDSSLILLLFVVINRNEIHPKPFCGHLLQRLLLRWQEEVIAIKTRRRNWK